MSQEQCSPDELRNLAARIVRTILDDEELVEKLAEQLVLERQKCPKDHKCEGDKFSCKRPFTCSNMHRIVKAPA